MFHWAYLCNDPVKLALMLSKLSPQPSLQQLHVVCNEANAHMRPEFNRLLQRCEVLNSVDCRVATDTAIIGAVREKLDRVACQAAMHYSLFVKLCMPILAVPGTPLLYTDDDVLVLNTVGDLLGSVPFTTTNLSDRLPYNSKGALELDALNDVFGSELLLEEYNHDKSDAGIWMLEADPEYWVWLNRFFAHPFVHNSVLAETGSTNYQRLWDQKFLTMYFIMRKAFVIRSVRQARVYIEHFDKKEEAIKGWAAKPSDKWPIFVHYGTSSHKPAYMTLFAETLRRQS